MRLQGLVESEEENLRTMEETIALERAVENSVEELGEMGTADDEEAAPAVEEPEVERPPLFTKMDDPSGYNARFLSVTVINALLQGHCWLKRHRG